MGILHGQSRCRASDRGAESKINGRKMRSKSRSRELSLKGHFWTPYITLADLGAGVLDSTVETAAYVFRSISTDLPDEWYCYVHRVASIEPEERNAALLHSLRYVAGRSGETDNLYPLRYSSIRTIALSPFVYWMSPKELAVYINFQTLENRGILARGGGSTADDFHYVRLTSEVPH